MIKREPTTPEHTSLCVIFLTQKKKMLRLQDLQVTSPDKYTRDGILPAPENARMWKSSWPVEPTTLYKYSELPRQNWCDILTLPRDCC